MTEVLEQKKKFNRKEYYKVYCRKYYAINRDEIKNRIALYTEKNKEKCYDLRKMREKLNKTTDKAEKMTILYKYLDMGYQQVKKKILKSIKTDFDSYVMKIRNTVCED